MSAELHSLRRHKHPGRRYRNNLAYIGARGLPSIAEDIKKAYPSLNVEPLELLQEPHYTAYMQFLAETLERLGLPSPEQA